MVSQFLITHFGLPSPAVGHKTIAAVIREYCVAETLNGSRPRTQGTSRDRGRLFLYLRGSDLWRIRHLSAAAESIRWGDGKKRAPRSFVTNQRYNGRAWNGDWKTTVCCWCSSRPAACEAVRAVGGRAGGSGVLIWRGGHTSCCYIGDGGGGAVGPIRDESVACSPSGPVLLIRTNDRRQPRPRTSHCRSGWRYQTAAQN